MSHIQDSKPLAQADQVLRNGAAAVATGPSLVRANRSCCCSAPPAFTVIVACKLPEPHSVDLLMCGHHYRQSRHALADLGALVFADDGHLV